MFAINIGDCRSVALVDMRSVFSANERSRRFKRSDSDPPLVLRSSPPSSASHSPVFSSSPKEHNQPHWLQLLKGLGRKRHRSAASSPSTPEKSLDVSWQLTHSLSLSEDNNAQDDFASSLAYDETGKLFAAGCRSGKVFVFHRDQESLRNQDNCPKSCPFRPYVSFQSHEPEFDYLKSVEIDEKISKLRWLKRPNNAHFLLTTNERIVKLWKLSERHQELESAGCLNGKSDCNFINALHLPKYKSMERTVVASPRRVFFEAHDFRINSLSVNSDLETFLTADDLRINLWHIEVPRQSFNIVDSKPENMEDLSEIITTAEFHPEICSLFAYGSTKGSIRLCDMRSQALCDQHAKLFLEKENEGTKTFFSDVVNCISDVKFSSSGRYLLARDYLNLKVWDLQMESQPVETYPVSESLRSKLCTLYEEDHILDKFECSWGCNDRFVASGTYSNCFKVFDRTSGRSVLLESNPGTAASDGHRKRVLSFGNKTKPRGEINTDSFDFQKKLLHMAWHPHENLLMNAVGNSLHLFQGKASRPNFDCV